MNFLKKKTKKQKSILLFAGLVVLLGLGAGVWQAVKSGQAADASPYKTAEVTEGDISLDASGSGKLIAGTQADLNFSVSGKVSQLNVKVGDVVKSGDILAVLDGREPLEVQLSELNLEVKTAQEEVDRLTNNPEEVLAEAKKELAEAQAAYSEAQTNLHQEGDTRCSTELTGSYYGQYQDQLELAAPWEKELNDPDTIYGKAYILEHLYKIWEERDKLYANWNYCKGYTDEEIAQSQADWMLAQANLDLAKSHYQAMVENGGVDQAAIELANAKLSNAQAQAALTQSQLSDLVMTAPNDATVTAINGAVGDEVSTSTFITLVDLDHPVMQIWMDETDLENISVGCAATVTFDSISGRTFAGIVSELSPVLSSSMGYSSLAGEVQLDSVILTGDQRLPIGLNGSVDVTCDQRTGALLVPLEALHTLEDGRTVAYVLKDDGSVEQREVETGVRSYLQAEVLSGLDKSELVITSGLELTN